MASTEQNDFSSRKSKSQALIYNHPDHLPKRTCVGCFQKFPQKDLIAIRRDKNRKVFVDLKNEISGRSVYLCSKTSCFLKATRRQGKNALEYGLKVKIPAEILDKLEQIFKLSQHEDQDKNKRASR